MPYDMIVFITTNSILYSS